MRWIGCLCVFICQSLTGQSLVDRALQDITRAITYDMYSAPGASRAYAYICLAGYEAARVTDKQYASFMPKFQDAPVIKRPGFSQKLDGDTVAAYAMYFAALHFVYAEDMLMQSWQITMGNPDTQDVHYQFGKSVAERIIQWSQSDGYTQTFTLDRYIPSNVPGKWETTPPDFAPALEPYFGTLRRFTSDANAIEKLAPLSKFSEAKDSLWYSYALNVYTTSQGLTAEQKAIVYFWDDNPFELIQQGHLQYAIKKVSPAGHWLDITRTALDSVHANPVRSIYTYALVAVVMADAMMETWEAKYTFATLRPETFINAYLDANWRPLIPSPPFPEYPSGHSCISAAAATILTHLFGTDFDFTDASETQYDLPSRSFSSFTEAAQEAGLSRFYGGIHFLPSVHAGAELGQRVAEQHLRTLK